MTCAVLNGSKPAGNFPPTPSPMSDIEIREFFPEEEDLLQAVGILRVQAWETTVAEAGRMATWLDEFDSAARHWVALRAGVPGAAARLSMNSSLAEVPDSESYSGIFSEIPDGPLGSLNRLVVHPSARRLGLSKRLDLIRLGAAEEMRCRSAILSTATGPYRVRQLQSFGFEFIGYGPRFQKPPLCYLPPPAVLLCRFPIRPGKAAVNYHTHLNEFTTRPVEAARP